jgi:pimeloyl-ACP methyl ester carboxylesterase
VKKAGPLVAIDLPGFGRSEGRADLMSPSKMGDFLNRILDALNLDEVHAIVPDVGTLAALFAAVERPTRYRTIVAGSGGTNLDLLGAPLKEVVESSRSQYDGVEGGGTVVSVVSDLTRITPPDEVLEDYRLSSLNNRWNEAADFVRAYKRDLPLLAELLPSITTPVLVISGNDDPFVPPSNGDFLRSRLPNCSTEILDAGHFVWEDRAAEYAALARGWIEKAR